MADHSIVGIGSSAGGLEAMQKLFTAMPDDSGLAFIVAAHLEPTQESHLTDLIGRCTRMAVVRIAAEIKVQPNHVYVIAPDQELAIQDGVIRPTKPTVPRGQRHPVDFFFRSLAEDQGERAIAIVLSGAGSNGSLGVRFIKAEGGVVLAQKPETAVFQGMPRSAISTGVVDLVLPPEKMPDALVRLACRTCSRQPAQAAEEAAVDKQLKTLLALVRIQTKRDFACYKTSTLLRRVYRRMGLYRTGSLESYIDLLRNDPDEIEALAADLTINVTGFFRDPEAWNTLAERVIAPLVRERPSGRAIRVWVPGCSTGEEAYSIAMLLIEQAEAAGKSFDVKLFATDVSEGVLPLARAGQYPSSIALDVGETRLKRFFALQDDTYKVRKVLRELITFAPQSVLQDPPFSHLDLISCRNFLIYIEPQAQKQVLAVFHFALTPEGHLFLGPAENVTGLEDLFQPISKEWRIFRRIGQSRHDLVSIPASRETTLERVQNRDMPVSSRELLDQALAERYALASVLIDSHHGVHYFRGPTENYLEPPRGEPTHNILAIARPGLEEPLRRAVAKALAEDREVISHARVQRNGKAQHVQVVVTPVSAGRDAARLMVSFFERANAGDGETPVLPETAHKSELQAELDTAREDLRLTVEQLEASNEEMKASNEEIRSINEELQASNEELETSKEEMQSLNEELNTVNNQLQAKVSELELHTNDLNNLLNGTDIATLFLDRQACIRWFTPTMKTLLELLPTDIGRPISHLASKFTDGDLADDARIVLAKLSPMESEATSNQGRRYLRRMVPYRTEDDRIDGVVVTFTEVTALKQAEMAARASEQRLRKVLDADAVGVLFLDKGGTVIDANEAFLSLTGYTRPDIDARALTWRALTPPEWAEASEEQMRKLAKTGRLGPYEKEYLRKDGSRRWLMFTGASLDDDTIVKYCIDISDRKRIEAERELLTRELSHRVKNVFAVIQALATQTDGRHQSVDAFREAFLGRLHALAKAHSLLIDTQWQGADLHALVDQVLDAYRMDRPEVIAMEGDPVILQAQQGLGLGMVIHELGTNAAKYGALADHNGRLRISWVAEDAQLHLRWEERQGPSVSPPSEVGFGSKLIENICAHQLRGTVERDYAADGLTCTIRFPLT
ncbi:MAG: PAS domain-containing protein [Rhodospirillales bacterium]|nr:PAS domain-containing protein [Rhodospirillales bacterium]